MTAPHPTRLRWSWQRRHVTALWLAVVAGAAALGARAAGTRHWPEPMPVEPGRVAAAREKIDPNVASAASLRRLGGIGPARAEAIVAYARTHGPGAFATAADLAKVRGIGPATVRRIAPHLALPPGH
jgi:competence ComEA-like helix-hairpin-helix protein